MKKKVFVLGSQGMAGHIIAKYLHLEGYKVAKIARECYSPYKVDFYIDVADKLKELDNIIYNFKPDYIINCIGILLPDAEKDVPNTIYINSYFPHWLEKITKETNSKIIHLSTDCIFDGKKGNYLENDLPTERHIYGKSKALGELNNSKDLTIRTSIIGEELKEGGSGLFEWFMKQKGTVKGYTNAMWNGVTTLELAKFISRTIFYNPDLSGIYHLCGEIISKFSLLNQIATVYKKDIKIIPDDKNKIIKNLVNTRVKETDFEPLSYLNQLKEQKKFNEKHFPI